MHKIKNDPKKYITRADLFVTKRPSRKSLERNGYSQKREEAFLTAPIDRAGYIDFRRAEDAREAAFQTESLSTTNMTSTNDTIRRAFSFTLVTLLSLIIWYGIYLAIQSAFFVLS